MTIEPDEYIKQCAADIDQVERVTSSTLVESLPLRSKSSCTRCCQQGHRWETLELLAQKRAGLELGVGPRLPHLHESLAEHYVLMMGKVAEIDRDGSPWSVHASNEELDAFFRRVVDA